MHKDITKEKIFIDGEWSMNNINNYICSLTSPIDTHNSIEFRMKQINIFELDGLRLYITSKGRSVLNQCLNAISMEYNEYQNSDGEYIINLSFYTSGIRDLTWIQKIRNSLPISKKVKINIDKSGRSPF